MRGSVGTSKPPSVGLGGVGIGVGCTGAFVDSGKVCSLIENSLSGS